MVASDTVPPEKDKSTEKTAGVRANEHKHMSDQKSSTKTSTLLPEKGRSQGRCGRWGGYGCLLIALTCISSLLALGLSAYNLKRLDQFQSGTNHRLSAVKQALEPLQGNPLAQEIKQLADKQQEFQIRVDDIAKEAQALQTTFQHPALMNDVWRLLKAQHCLELAQINEKWSRDQQAAIALLAQAATFLEPLTEEPVLLVKQAIMQEKATLVDRAEKEKISSILSQLEGIQHNLFQLPLRRSVLSNGKTNSTSTELSSAASDKIKNTDWQTHLRESMQALKKLVVVHHGIDAIEPLLPVYQTLLQESIHLELQQAQWALMQRDLVVYRLALQQVLELMHKTFDTKASLTRETIQQIETLKQLPLNLSNEVVVNRSLQLLEQVIKNNRLLTTPSNHIKGDSTNGDIQTVP